MPTLRPFHALRPRPDRAPEVSAVPYDVVSTEEARQLAAGRPYSFLHVSRPEIDLPDGTDPHADSVYAKAAEAFATLRERAPLEAEAYPALYVYRLRMGERVQTGVAGIASLDEYDADVIKKHERTRRDKEDDRTRHMLTLGAQTGPVFLTYRGRREIDDAVARAMASPPLFDLVAPDGVAHTIWRLSEGDSAALARAFEAVPYFYIADGHHRAASASRARKERRKAGSAPGSPADFFLTVAFPAAQVSILPYNRVVKDLGGREPEALLSELASRFSLREVHSAGPEAKGEVGVYLAGRWHRLTLSSGDGAGPIQSLDADRLQRQVLEPLLGIGDVRTDPRIDFVGGVRGTRWLEKLVDSGKAAVAFAMYPVSLEELMAISDAGEIMPPKSTWFEPKLRDGLLIHEIGGGAS
jgi:uncharacterized protein (DUF1015 family)